MKPFPANKEDVYRFIVDLRRAMYSEEQQQMITQILQKNAQNIGQTIGQLAAKIVLTVIQRRMQEQDIKPHVKLAVMGLKTTIEGLAEIANLMGIQVTEQDMQEAAKVGGAIAEHAGQKPQGPQGPQGSPMQAAAPQVQQQQPGLLGGAQPGMMQ